MDEFEMLAEKAGQWIDGWEAAKAGDPEPGPDDRSAYAFGYRAATLTGSAG